jgi:hypothetical protein
VLQRFLDEHDEAPTALGFVFELYNVTPAFALCAHLGPLADDEDERWNSGDYDFPAGLSGVRHELGPAFHGRFAALHAQAQGEPHHGPIYQGLIELCMQVLRDLRGEGLVSADVDLNVSEVGDPSDVVAKRHAAI